MNLPNKLTTTRLVMTPIFFLFFFSYEIIPMPSLVYGAILVLLYGVMELTDLLDGKIARKYHLVTDLGKVMDPFADVICHLTFFTCLMYCGIMPVIPFALIMWREFSQSFMRMLLMGKGKPLAANIFGKAKTCLYAFSCVAGFVLRILTVIGTKANVLSVFALCLNVVFYLAAFASVMSFAIYIKGTINSGVLKDMTR
ncbi:MAG: CDP-diacylglycerol--glycerol-3-phosphate 3-phosphatidyltransferase [Sphaerochaetaceae bacterium]|nr:CDP-diacylglycerol--glycerol-3-phosphate 3-phosphatidyltransferase [Sphaerochaetaceae bacterium]